MTGRVLLAPDDPATPVDLAYGDGALPGLWLAPPDARWGYVLCHGAGAGMRHAFMVAIAVELAGRGVATLRYELPYMARGGTGFRRPDPPAVCIAAVRAACAAAAALAPGLPLVAGGKSFGGRMTSQAEADAPLGVRGLIFLGFPLHLADKPAITRAAHLAGVTAPMLFVQGDRDALAEPALLRPVVAGLGARAALVELAGADHGFAVPARSGRSNADVIVEIGAAVATWLREIEAVKPKAGSRKRRDRSGPRA